MILTINEGRLSHWFIDYDAVYCFSFLLLLIIFVGIVLFFYNCLWYVCLPFLRLQLYFKAKRRLAYAEGLGQRFGLEQIHQKVDVCVHAVSVGEVIAASPMVEMMLNANLKVLMTTMTPTGLAQAKRLFGDKVAYQFLPYDFSFAIKRFIDARQFKLLLIMETELWPGLLSICHQRGITCILGNARISNRSYGRYLKTKWFWSKLLRYFKVIGVQSEEDKARFLRLGAQENQLLMMGNLKFSQAPIDVALLKFWQIFKRENAKRFIFICGSTHEGEDALLLETFAQLRQKYPQLLMVLVPRHPERFNDVAKLIVEKGHAFARLSEGVVNMDKIDILLLDKMGELSASYAAADLAFVGGSLVPIGGHNVLEPLFFKVPVLCGPYMQNQQDLLRILQEKALIEVLYPESMVDAIEKYLTDHELRTSKGEKGFRLVQENQQAKEMLWQVIQQYC